MIRPAQDNAMTKNTRGQMPALLQDDEAIRQLLPTTVQAALAAVMDAASGAGKGERSDARRGCRSGHHRRRVTTPVGTLELRVPQDREVLFSSEVFARCQLSVKALLLALAGM
jgi:putative transposase